MVSIVECPVFYPDILEAFNFAYTNIEQRELQTKELNQHYSKLNWVTNGLSEELSMAFPSDTDIDINNNNERNTTWFKKKLTVFVCSGRYFTSPVQFAQVVNIICSQWAVQITNTNNSIQCHYAASSCKQQHLHPNLP